jgi:hypothetical protein
VDDRILVLYSHMRRSQSNRLGYTFRTVSFIRGLRGFASSYID